jgi:hypothetical protein
MENSFKAPLNIIQRPVQLKGMSPILQFPFLHEKIVHGPRHEEVGVCGPTKICLKPDGNLSLTFCVGNDGRIDIFAIFTNI